VGNLRLSRQGLGRQRDGYLYVTVEPKNWKRFKKEEQNYIKYRQKISDLPLQEKKYGFRTGLFLHIKQLANF
jgi:hypothetical protein